MHSVACLCVCVGVCASESFPFLCHIFLQSRSLKTEPVIKKNPTERRIFGKPPAKVPFFKQAAAE